MAARRDKATAIDDAALKSEILRSLRDRDPAMSVCPSDIARALADKETWRLLLPRIRVVLLQLAEERRVVLTRGTQQLMVTELKGGPIRIRRGPHF